MSRIYENTEYNLETLGELEEICKKASQVNGWYAHKYENGNIRGPWHRWVNVEEGSREGVENGYIAPKESDIDFIAAAMNHFPHLIKALKEKI